MSFNAYGYMYKMYEYNFNSMKLQQDITISCWNELNKSYHLKSLSTLVKDLLNFRQNILNLKRMLTWMYITESKCRKSRVKTIDFFDFFIHFQSEQHLLVRTRGGKVKLWTLVEQIQEVWTLTTLTLKQLTAEA